MELPTFDRTAAQELSTKQLLETYNALAVLLGDTPLTAWKKSKDSLIDRVEDQCTRAHKVRLEAEAAAAVDARDEVPVDEDVAAVADMTDAEFDAAMAAETADVTEPVVPADEPLEPTGARTIRAAAIELLCHVAYHEDRNKKSDPSNRVEAAQPGARSVGIAYDEIIDAIKDEFPDANTSVACLRWYSVKIRVEEHGYEGLRLPQRRPRAKPRTGA